MSNLEGYSTDEISLRTLLESIHNIYHSTHKKSKTSLSLNFAADLPESIHSNRSILLQIVSGLICRALHHTEEGEISLICMSHKDRLIINIADSGDGKSEEPVKSVCLLSPSQKNDLPEQCLINCPNKLQVVKNRCENLNGTIDIKSELGIGTVITLTLPIDSRETYPSQRTVGERMVQGWFDSFARIPDLKRAILKCFPVLKKEIAEILPLVFNLELESAKEKIHSLKGFTGGFGLNEIYEKLKEIESGIKTSPIVRDTLICKTIELDYLIRLIPGRYLDFDSSDNQPPVADQDFRIYKGLRDKTVLVAEDQPMNQEMVAYILKNLDLSYQIVSNGKEVLESLQREQFDLLLLDLQMPVLDGIETIKRIRKKSTLEKLPIIVVTAYDRQESEEVIQCADFIKKPFNIDDLSRRIEKVLHPSWFPPERSFNYQADKR